MEAANNEIIILKSNLSRQKDLEDENEQLKNKLAIITYEFSTKQNEWNVRSINKHEVSSNFKESSEFKDLQQHMLHLREQLATKDIGLVNENQNLRSHIKNLEYNLNVKELNWQKRLDAAYSEVNI